MPSAKIMGGYVWPGVDVPFEGTLDCLKKPIRGEFCPKLAVVLILVAHCGITRGLSNHSCDASGNLPLWGLVLGKPFLLYRGGFHFPEPCFGSPLQLPKTLTPSSAPKRNDQTNTESWKSLEISPEHPNPHQNRPKWAMNSPTPKWYQNGFDNHSHFRFFNLGMAVKCSVATFLVAVVALLSSRGMMGLGGSSAALPCRLESGDRFLFSFLGVSSFSLFWIRKSSLEIRKGNG